MACAKPSVNASCRVGSGDVSGSLIHALNRSAMFVFMGGNDIGASPWRAQDTSTVILRTVRAARVRCAPSPIRLHDLPHVHISTRFALWVDVRVISDRVGHSGSRMTRDYAAVAAEVSRAATGGSRPSLQGARPGERCLPGGLTTDSPGTATKGVRRTADPLPACHRSETGSR